MNKQKYITFQKLYEEIEEFLKTSKNEEKKLLLDDEIGNYFKEMGGEKDDQGDGLDLRDLEYKKWFEDKEDSFYHNEDHEVPWETE